MTTQLVEASATTDSTTDAQRATPRLKLPPMYTLVRVRLPGDSHYRWTGHVYDVSLAGMRFELDEALPPGTSVETRTMLPGQAHTLFHATGRIIRLHDEADEPGPMRMGMAFDGFTTPLDRRRLAEHLEQAGPLAA